MTRPKESTIRKLFALSRNLCAMPQCKSPIIEAQTNTIIGEVCHISAQSKEGPRFNPSQSNEDRQSFKNLILLCRNHHKEIDDRQNEKTYTTEYLVQLKLSHEKNTIDTHSETFAVSDAIVFALLDTIKSYESTKVHMDFRGAIFKAGGEGGHPHGGGGSGGIINIVGVTSKGFHEKIDANGGGGQPSGGGGGAGQVNFLGRNIDKNDIESGLTVSSLFLTTAVNLSGGLFNVIGGGWTWLELVKIPSSFKFSFVCLIDTGSIPHNTLLRFNYKFIDPDKFEVKKNHFDLAVEESRDLVRRFNLSIDEDVEFSKTGVWQLLIESSDQILASYSFELRLKGRL